MPASKLPPTPIASESSAASVSSLYQQLSTVAADLNGASDELGKSIATLDTALKNLNLGISTWVRISCGTDEHSYGLRELGYDKIGKTWGIAIRTEDGQEMFPEHADVECWLFNEAPRDLRLDAVDRLPDLLRQLIVEARDTAQRVREKATKAYNIAELLSQNDSDRGTRR